MNDSVIKVENLSKLYRVAFKRNRHDGLRHQVEHSIRHPWQWLRSKSQSSAELFDEFWALQDVSFDVKQGEVVGVIGRNGAGKSTLLKLLSRITEPTSGRIRLRGRVASLLEVGTGFHPELTGRENIFLNGAILGMTRVEIRRKFDEIVAFSEIEKFLDTPVKRYSSGMYVRLAFAVAAHLEPEILIVDEVLAVGDVQFQKKCLGKIQSVAMDEQRTVLLVSHNLQTVRQICQRVLLLHKGRLASTGDAHESISQYMGIETNGRATGINLTGQARQRQVDGARLMRIEFQNSVGQAALQVSRRSDLTVKVHFSVERPLEHLDISMAVVHVEGQRVFSEFYSDQHERLKLPQGEFVLRFTLPLRYLKLESYFLVLELLNGGRHCDMVRNLPLPELVDESLDPYVESRRSGIVRIPVSWERIEVALEKEQEFIPSD
jgi:lipopolysaccharide transport system ATP-binding protein